MATLAISRDNHRGIVIDAGNGLYILTRILDHDDTSGWMARNEFGVNEATGALEIRDVEAIAEFARQVPAPSDAPALFAHRRNRDFVRLGVDAAVIPALRAFTDQNQLQGVLGLLPPVQAEAIIMLLDDESVDDIFGELVGSIDPATIEPDDLAAAVVAPASQKQFHVFEGEAELAAMLALPLAQWRVYLHHTQRAIAYRPVYNGPARVTGGAGTGKTVVAMHRTLVLAQGLEDRSGRPILFTTFTRNLAEASQRDLSLLGGSELLDVVEVQTVDALANRVVRDVEGHAPAIADGELVLDLWQRAADQAGCSHSPRFLDNEWEQVILAHGCRSRTEYLQVSRAGRGVPLDRRTRSRVWDAVEAFLQQLMEGDRRTYLQLADTAAGYLANRSVKPFRHIVVDEAQDLHEAQWRFLRAAVDEGPNDLFIVGDSHQRIYDRRTPLSRVGINIVGRSRRLRINYRTTHEILRWALALLGECTYDDLDKGPDRHTAGQYHSFLHGSDPAMVGAGSRQDELAALAEQVQRWVADGIAPAEIGVAARTSQAVDDAKVALDRAGLPVVTLGRSEPTADGVRLGTMHRMKGLEFRAVAVTRVDDDTVPAAWALTPAAEDEIQHRLDLDRERCLLYVACTRAREELWVGWSGRASRFLGAVLPEEP